jgi:glucan phosphoethanolaminetransferase (alkaline phosphatase superfamily)
MLNIIVLLTLALLTGLSILRKDARLKLVTAVLIVIVLIIRDVSIVVNTYSIMGAVQLRGDALDQFNKVAKEILEYYYWTSLYIFPAYAIIIILLLRGSKRPK